MVCYIVSGLLLMFFWCPCMATNNVNVQYKAGSYGNEKLIRKWTRSVFLFFFDLMGTRMVQIRMAKSV